MESLKTTIAQVNWEKVATGLHERGFVTIEKFLNPVQCQNLCQLYLQDAFRKKVVMERHRFGLGEYKYFDYPLPELLQEIREGIYPNLVGIANKWMEVLNINRRFPLLHHELLKQCHKAGQKQPTPLILKYGKGGFNTLHQDLYGEVYFPLQAALFLSDPKISYSGGEFVLTQQIPRAQSQAIVLKPMLGDMIIFTTNFRPIKGNKGYFKANMKHGVSTVHEGERYTLGIIFHDATS